MKILILAARLSLNSKIYLKDELVNISLDTPTLNLLIKNKDIQVIEYDKVISKVENDLNGDGIFDVKDKAIASKVLNDAKKFKK